MVLPVSLVDEEGTAVEVGTRASVVGYTVAVETVWSLSVEAPLVTHSVSVVSVFETVTWSVAGVVRDGPVAGDEIEVSGVRSSGKPLKTGSLVDEEIAANVVSVDPDTVLLGSPLPELEAVDIVNVISLVSVSELVETELVVSNGVDVGKAVVAVNDVSDVSVTVVLISDVVNPDETVEPVGVVCVGDVSVLVEAVL
jgi:hypothetical protein